MDKPIKNETLELGDIVFKFNYGKIMAKLEVTHVTRTQAVLNPHGKTPDDPKGGTQVKRVYEGYYGNIRSVGARAYSPYSYYIYSEDLENKWVRALYLQALQGFDFKDMSLDELRVLYNRATTDDHLVLSPIPGLLDLSAMLWMMKNYLTLKRYDYNNLSVEEKENITQEEFNGCVKVVKEFHRPEK